tara:strand:+ start:1080 stop:1616 length:537 start_codon:yes stop_codon:yes gene_type:complete
MRKEKGFTLIELLVVVAIIGILAAVGTVAYNGYTEGAKKSSSKSNHASVVKYIIAEDAKCTVGSDKVFGVKVDNDVAYAKGTTFNCTERTASQIAESAIEALKDFKNPYANTTVAVVEGSGADLDAAKKEAATKDAHGKVYVAGDDTNDKVYVSTCHTKPCTTADDKDIVFNELEVAE